MTADWFEFFIFRRISGKVHEYVVDAWTRHCVTAAPEQEIINSLLSLDNASWSVLLHNIYLEDHIALGLLLWSSSSYSEYIGPGSIPHTRFSQLRKVILWVKVSDPHVVHWRVLAQ